MKKLLLITLVLTIWLGANAQEKYSRVKIYANNAQLAQIANLGIEVDHGQRKRDTWLVTDISATQIQTLQNNGFELDVEIDDVQAYYIQRSNQSATKDDDRADCGGTTGSSGFDPVTPTNFQLGTMAGFYRYQEFLDELDAMQVAYPNLITAKSPISTFTTNEGRPVYWVRISDNATTDEAEKEVLYSALHHSREPASLSQLIFYMWYLLENYGTNDEITYLVDNTEMYFVPMLNPDGYIHNEVNDPNGGGMHRKNKRNVGTTNPGIDLNRNYGYHWNESGTSPDVNNDTYAGTGAFSEPETQAMKWFCENHNFEFAHNAHTYGNLQLFPIGWANNEFAADHDYFTAFTSHQVLFNGFTNEKSSTLYPAAGDSDDWMYNDDLVAKPKIYAMTPEIGSDADGFWPAQSRIIPICKSMVWMNLILAHLPHVYGYATDTDPSKIETFNGYFHYDLERLGLTDGDITVSMQAISGIQTLGAPNVHTMNLMDVDSDSISFVLDPSLGFGDEIKYVLKTDNGTWTRTDTIIKTFGTGTTVFTDDANTVNNWSGDWGTTTEYFVSAGSSITDSPNSDYSNGASTEMVLNDIITFENATYAYVQYYARWAIENDYDYTQFMISTDNGNSWAPLCGKYTNLGTSNQDSNNPLYDGTQTSWVLEEIDLTAYIGMPNIRFKFTLNSDNFVTDDGFAFDDFKIYTDGFNDSGVGELSENEISIYPNPANNVVNIYSNGNNDLKQIEIYNNLGQKVEVVNGLSNKTTININDYEAGIYIVKIMTTSNQIITKKFTVIK